MEVFQLTLDAPRAASREKISLLDSWKDAGSSLMTAGKPCGEKCFRKYETKFSIISLKFRKIGSGFSKNIVL